MTNHDPDDFTGGWPTFNDPFPGQTNDSYPGHIIDKTPLADNYLRKEDMTKIPPKPDPLDRIAKALERIADSLERIRRHPINL